MKGSALAARQHGRGMALMVVLLVVALISLIATHLGSLVQLNIRQAANREQYQQAYWFALGGEKLARYSFIGFDPFLVVEANSSCVTLRKGKDKREVNTEPLGFLKELLAVYKPVMVDGLPRFTGGGVGYFSFDAIRWVERLPNPNRDKIGMPELIFGLYQTVIAFDHLKQEIILCSELSVRPGIQDLPVELLGGYLDPEIAGRHTAHDSCPHLSAPKIDPQVKAKHDHT